MAPNGGDQNAIVNMVIVTVDVIALVGTGTLAKANSGGSWAQCRISASRAQSEEMILTKLP